MLFSWLGGSSPGIPDLSSSSIAFLELIAEAGGGEGREGVGGQRAEQLGDVAARGSSPPRSLLRSIWIWSVPGMTLATAVASLGSMPALSRSFPGLRVDLVVGLLDQAADVDVDVGEAAVRGGGDRVLEAGFVGERVAAGGVDGRLEGRFVVGDDERVVDEADRRPFRAADLEVDAFVGGVLVGLFALLGLGVDEVLRRFGVGALDRDHRFGEIALAVEADEGDARLLAEPGLDFLGEVDRFAVVACRAFQLFDDQVRRGRRPRRSSGRASRRFRSARRKAAPCLR